MSEYPHLPLFTDAFIADTMHLNAEETGAYLMLLMVAWRSPDCGLPDDDVKLARYARVSERRWKKIKPTVMAFWDLEETEVAQVWRQKRLKKERKFVEQKRQKLRNNGAKGGRPKLPENNETGKAKGPDPKNQKGKQNESKSKAPIPIPIPIGNTGSLKTTSHSDASERGGELGLEIPQSVDRRTPRRSEAEFQRWYQTYPRHKAVAKAREKYWTARKKATEEQLLRGAERAREEFADRPPEKIPYPATWLHGEQWLNEPDAPANGHAGYDARPPPDATPEERVEWFAEHYGVSSDEHGRKDDP